MLSLREQTPRSRAEIWPIVSLYCTVLARVMYDSDPERKSETPLLTGIPPPAVPLLRPIPPYPPLVSLREARSPVNVALRRRCTASLPPLSFPRRKDHRTQRARSRDGVGLCSECIRVSRARGGLRESSPSLPLRLPLLHLPAREPSRFPSSPRSPRSFFPAPLPLRERARETRENERRKEKRGERGGGTRGDLWST